MTGLFHLYLTMKKLRPLLTFYLFLPLALHTQPMHHTLDSFLHASFSPTQPGAALLILQNDKVIYENAVGLADLGRKIPLSPKTNFRMASVTKQFTAMAILLLEKQGKLSLEDPLSRFFPDFAPAGRAMTIRQLLTHSSGICDYEEVIPDTQTAQLSDADVLSLIKNIDRSYFTPGESFRYSNSGYCLLALIVEKASGRSFAGFLEAEIFRPLGMKHTCVYEAGKPIPNRAFGYARNGKGEVVFSDQSTTSATKGDGGVYTSLRDYLKWHRALMKNKLIDLEQALDRMKTTMPGRTGFYGAGWFFNPTPAGRPEMFHSGSTCGFSNMVVRNPAKGVLVLYFSNLADNHEASLPFFDYLKQAGLLHTDFRAWHEATR